MLSWIICVATLIILYNMYYSWKNKRSLSLLSKFTRVKPSFPVIGNLHLVTGHTDDLWDKVSKLIRKFGSTFIIWAFQYPFLIFTKLEDIQDISNKCSHRQMYGVLDEILGDGIASLELEKWKKTRRLISPAFNPVMLKKYLIVFNEQAQILTQILQMKADTNILFDVWPSVINANVDMITENTAGVKLHSQESFNNEYTTSAARASQIIIQRIISPWLVIDFIFRIYCFFTGDRRSIKILHEIPEKAIQMKKEKRKIRKYKLQNEKVPNTLLDILLSAQDIDLEFTDDQIKTEMIHIIAAGSETSAITICFLMLMFALRQDIQKKVYEEITNVLKNNQAVDMDHLCELKYLEQCIKETIRAFSLVPMTFRSTNEDLKMNDDKIIPKDCTLILLLKAVHLNSELFPNPEQWNPDNFAPEAIENRPKNSFVGFGLGPRSCIGSKYAMASIKTQIAHILRNFHLTTDITYECIKIATDVAQRSKNGYPIKLTSRQMKIS